MLSYTQCYSLYKRFLATPSSQKSYPEVNVHLSSVPKGSRAICIFCFSFKLVLGCSKPDLDILQEAVSSRSIFLHFVFAKLVLAIVCQSFPHCESYGLSFPFVWLCLRRGFKYYFGKGLFLKHMCGRNELDPKMKIRRAYV